MDADDDDDEEPQPVPSQPREPHDAPPLLDYSHPSEIDSEPWPNMLRAFAVVFGALLFLFVIFFGLCGVLGHGCG
jgi:hypothetical protein